MTGLHTHAGDYLALRRAVGFKLARTEQLLGNFVDFVEQDREYRRAVDDHRGMPRSS